LQVTLTLDTAPREVKPPADLARALAAVQMIAGGLIALVLSPPFQVPDGAALTSSASSSSPVGR